MRFDSCSSGPPNPLQRPEVSEMTVTAYVLVKSNTGEADRVKESIEAIDGVVDGHIVAGDVDFIVKLSVESPARVKDIAASGILGIDGVEDTQTYIAMG